jgi:tetratricopeptide (TPR) repeat protein
MSDARELYREAIKLFRAAKLDDAIARLNQAIGIDPAFHDAYEALGEVYSRAGRLDDAIAITKKFCEVAPDAIMAHTNLSRFYQKKGMVPEAEAEQGKARLLSWKEELKKGGAGAQPDLAAPTAASGAPQPVMMGFAGKSPEAPAQPAGLVPKSDTFRRMVELNPNDPLARFSLAKALADEGRASEAAAAFEALIALKPDYTVAYLGLGKALEAGAERDRAIAAYRRGIAVAGEKGDLMPKQDMERRLAALTAAAK